MVRCDKELAEFDGTRSYRRHIARDLPFWSTLWSLEEDMLVIATHYSPCREMCINTNNLSNEAILITNPLGVSGMNALVQNIAAPTRTDTDPEANGLVQG